MNDEKLNRLAAAYEEVVAKQLRKLKYSVRRLDFQKESARPDFLVSNSSGAQMLCEVKAIFSAGYKSDKGVHVSMLDETLSNFGVFETKIDRTKIDDCLSDAVRKRMALVKDCPKFARLPLLVAIFFDFFADFLHAYPRTFHEDVSGILTIERDVARIKAFEELSIEEQERRIRNPELTAGLPPHSKDFALRRNKAARRKVPKDFQIQCHTERYDDSL